MNNDTSSTPKTVPVKELYELIIFWMTHRFNSEHYVLELLLRIETEGIKLPRGLLSAVTEGQFEGKSAVEILKNHIATL